MNHMLSNVNITNMQPLLSPRALKHEEPIAEEMVKYIKQGRKIITDIIHHKDRRLLLIIGPCSIHDDIAAHEYGKRIAEIATEVIDKIVVVMRVYFEKPRTNIGWRGMIFDPHLNGSYEIETGLRMARSLLCHLTAEGVHTATEMLDPIVPQYIDDLICWASIGARTTESQTHRELASGLSVPVGFKNSTDGTIESAINAIVASRKKRKFIGINYDGKTSVVTTKGNINTHLILRGGKNGANYDAQTIVHAIKLLRDNDLPQSILIDCSHGNSQKNHRNQQPVFEAIMRDRCNGRSEIVGAMIESNLYAGQQPIQGYSGKLKYGVSITDACIGWNDTVRLIRYAYRLLK